MFDYAGQLDSAEGLELGKGFEHDGFPSKEALSGTEKRGVAGREPCEVCPR